MKPQLEPAMWFLVYALHRPAPFPTATGSISAALGADGVANLPILERRKRMSGRQKNTTPGRVTRDSPGRSPSPAQPLYSQYAPSCVCKDLPSVFKNQELGEEKQKGSAMCLFSARLGAGGTVMNVTQLVPLRRSHHYSNTGSCEL